MDNEDHDDPTNEETMEDRGRKSLMTDQRTKFTKTLTKPSMNVQSQADLRTLQTHLSRKSLNNASSLKRLNANPLDRGNIFKAE